MGFFDGLRDTFNSVVSTVKNGVSEVWGTGKSFVSGVKDFATSTVQGGQAVLGKLIDKAGDTATNLGQSLSMPLLLLGAAAGGFLLLKNK